MREMNLGCTTAPLFANAVYAATSSIGCTTDAPIAGGHFLGDYMGLVTAGRVVHPVFGIATGLDRTTEFTRRIVLD